MDSQIITLAVTALGSGGLGAGIRPMLEYWKGQRVQSDEVAMSLVQKLGLRIERLEEASKEEREICDAKLSEMRHELKNVQGNFDALLLAIEIAPEKAAEVVAKIKARREPGERRQSAQIDLSTKRVLRDGD